MPGFADHESHRHELEGKLGRFLVLKSEIGFTSEQGEKFRSTLKRNAGLTKSGRDEVRKAAEAMRAAVLAEGADADSVRKAASALAAAIGDASVADLSLRQELLSVLTDEQRVKISSVIKENQRASEKREASPKNDS